MLEREADTFYFGNLNWFNNDILAVELLKTGMNYGKANNS
jgi:hypothetical protein